MSKPKSENKESVISFRVAEEVHKQVKKEARKRKQTKAEFVQEIFLPALEKAVAVTK